MVSVDCDNLSLGSEFRAAALAEWLERRLSAAPTVDIASRSNATWNLIYGRPVEEAPRVDWTINLKLKTGSGDDSKYIVTAALQVADERASAQVTVSGSKLDAALVSELSDKIWHELNVEKATGDWRLADEAGRFNAVGESLWAQNQKAAAFEAAEMALFLGPNNVEIHRRLSERMLKEVEGSFPGGVNKSEWNRQQ